MQHTVPAAFARSPVQLPFLGSVIVPCGAGHQGWASPASTPATAPQMEASGLHAVVWVYIHSQRWLLLRISRELWSVERGAGCSSTVLMEVIGVTVSSLSPGSLALGQKHISSLCTKSRSLPGPGPRYTVTTQTRCLRHSLVCLLSPQGESTRDS